jgi:hypothetical protein
MEQNNLTNITDAHCIELAEILGVVHHLSEVAKITQVKQLIERRYNGVTNLSGMSWYKGFKFLEQKGYKIED